MTAGNSRIISYVLAALYVLLQFPGMILNLVCARVFLQRLREQHKAFPYPILFAFTFSAIDGFICLNYAVATSMSFVIRPGMKLGVLVCLIESYSFVCFFLGLRAVMCVYVATFNFIKLLFPFTQSPLPRRQLIGLLTLNALILSSLSLCGQVLEYTYDSVKGQCLSRIYDSTTTSHKFMMLIRLISLVTFSQLYLFPYSATIYLYRRILKNLKNHGGDEIKMAVFLELRKGYRLDGILGFYFNLTLNLICFLTEFSGTLEVQISRTELHVIYLVTVLYSTIYPYLCIRNRRIYKPVAEILGGRFNRRPTVSTSSGI